jgi:hypothetical protein
VAGVVDLERAAWVLAAVVPPVQAQEQEYPDRLAAYGAGRLGVLVGLGIGGLVEWFYRVQDGVEGRGGVAGQEQQRFGPLPGCGGGEPLGSFLRAEFQRGAAGVTEK